MFYKHTFDRRQTHKHTRQLLPPPCPEHAALLTQVVVDLHRPVAQGALVLQDTFRFGHGVRYGHAVVSTEDQQLNTARVQIQEAVPPNHTPPGLAVVVHMSADISQQDNRVPRWGTLQHRESPPPGDSRKAGDSEPLFCE